MNDAHLHLIINHFPIVLIVVGIITIISSLIFRSEAIRRMAYFFLILAAITGFMADQTGEGAEEIVEAIQGIDHHLVHEHEEIAEVFMKLLIALGALSILGMWASIKKKSFAKIISIAILCYSLFVMYYAQKAGTSGGEIRHEEIRDDYVVPDSNEH